MNVHRDAMKSNCDKLAEKMKKCSVNVVLMTKPEIEAILREGERKDAIREVTVKIRTMPREFFFH